MINRRNFMVVGSLFGAHTVGLNSFANDKEQSEQDKSVIWIWLGGGPSQFETFNPNWNDVPEEYRSTTGIIHNTDGVKIGGLWNSLGTQMKRFVTVNSFGHNDSSHLQATHYMMDATYNKERTQTASQKDPSHGSVVSAIFGPNRPNGLPNYVHQGKIDGGEGAWLGGKYNPFDPSKKENLVPKIELNRFAQRFYFMEQIDKGVQQNELSKSWQDMKLQAKDVIMGQASKAFDIESEPQRVKDDYGKGVGEQLLLARRLVEAGTKFVTIHYGGWDMHTNIASSLQQRVGAIDKALTALINDIWSKGLNKNVMIVVTGEFGRTKLNSGAGRDHWGRITPLLISGGDYEMGRTIGTSDKSYYPEENVCGPEDLRATLFDHFAISKTVQRTDNSGRPRYLLEGGKCIL